MIEPGTIVMFEGKQGVSLGPVFRYSVWWVLVDFGDEINALILESALEIINEKG